MYGDQTALVQKNSKSGVNVMGEREYKNLRDQRKRFSTTGEWDKFFEFIETIRARMSEKEQVELEKSLTKKSRQFVL
jgi:hypothetical protein